MGKLKWLLVGAGDIARKRVAPALSTATGSEIAAVCDVREQLAKEVAEEHGAKETFTDFSKALTDSSADSVYLATPVWLHVDQAIQSLNAGKHVIVEKPLGLDIAQCHRLVDAAQKSEKLATCAYFRRFYPRYLYTKDMLDKGEFGQVVSLRMTYFTWFNPTPDDPKYWRVVRAKSGGGPLSDMGTHMFDVLIGLFGLPLSVYARCENLVHQWEVEDSAALIMKLANGAQVTASFNWNSRTWRHEFEVVGTEAKLDWLPYDSGPITKTVGRQTDSIDLPNSENVHLPMVEDFVQAALTGRSPLISISEAAKTNTLLDAIYRSAAENREVIL